MDRPGPTSHQATAGGPPVPVRRPAFGLRPGLQPCWTPLRPEFACAANAISLLMPHVEPFLVRAVAGRLDGLEPALAAEARAYVGQESQHHREHRRFNRFLIGRYPGLGRVDRWAAGTFRRLERRRVSGPAGAAYALAFATTSETIAYSAARWFEGRRRHLLDGADPTLAGLFLWHLAEEVEHKSVAFDVQLATGVSHWHRLRAMTFSLVMVLWFVIAGTTVMLWGERRLAHPVAWLRLMGWSLTFGFEVLPNLATSLLPGYHPAQLTDPLWYEVWLRQLDHEQPPDDGASAGLRGRPEGSATWAYDRPHG